MKKTVQPIKQHSHTFILCHGRDSNTTEFASDFLECQDSANQFLHDIFPHLRIVFPAAKPLQWNRADVVINQYFDMSSTEHPHEDEEQQRDTLITSSDEIIEIIQQEAQIVGYENVILGGISQGCATAIHALLRCDQQLGGFIGFSGWLPLPSEFNRLYARSRKAIKTPVLLEHCSDDEVITSQYGEELRDGLEELGMSVEWRSYADGGHWINEPNGFEDVVRFVQ